MLFGRSVRVPRSARAVAAPAASRPGHRRAARQRMGDARARAGLKAGYLEDWHWNATLSGTPRGGDGANANRMNRESPGWPATRVVRCRQFASGALP